MIEDGIKKYRKIKIENFKILKHEKLDPMWLKTLIASLHALPPVPYAPNRSRAYVKLPANNYVNSVFVKLYAHTDCQSRGIRRTNPLRRLLPRYASKEGAAYLKFQRLGLTVPEILAFGEEWKFGIRNRGLFVVEALEAPSLQVLLHKTRNHEWIARILKTITKIHRAGVTHGDAHLVNFIGLDRKIYSIDIDKSKAVSEKGRITDLINIMAGIFLEINDTDRIKEGLSLYESFGLKIPLRKDELISIAMKKSRNVGDLDRARYYAPKPQSICL